MKNQEEKEFFDLLDKACTTIVKPEPSVIKPKAEVSKKISKNSQ